MTPICHGCQSVTRAHTEALEQQIRDMHAAAEAMQFQLAEARAALVTLARERNTWARQMADIRDERDSATAERDERRTETARLATERDVAQVEADHARSALARVSVAVELVGQDVRAVLGDRVADYVEESARQHIRAALTPATGTEQQS